MTTEKQHQQYQHEKRLLVRLALIFASIAGLGVGLILLGLGAGLMFVAWSILTG